MKMEKYRVVHAKVLRQALLVVSLIAVKQRQLCARQLQLRGHTSRHRLLKERRHAILHQTYLNCARVSNPVTCRRHLDNPRPDLHWLKL